MTLKGKNCLVTGGAGHLGASMTRSLAESGASVVVGARGIDRAEELACSLRAEGLDVEALLLDVTSDSSVFEACEELKVRFSGGVHGIVNNAYSGDGGGLWDQQPADYLAAVDVVIGGAVRLLHGLRPMLEAAGKSDGASIVNVASMYGMVSPDPSLYEDGFEHYHNPPAYGAAKAALIQWTRYCATHLSPAGIRSNVILPGPFPSNSVQNESQEFVSRLQDRVPFGRIGQPDDLDGLVSLLISDAGSYMNGSVINVDGGWTCS